MLLEIAKVFAEMCGVLAILFLYSWLLLITHELGHVVGGLVARITLLEVGLGKGRLLRTWNFGTAKILWYQAPLGGWVIGVPASPRLYRWREVIFTLGGPLASAAMVGLAFYVQSRLHTAFPLSHAWLGVASQFCVFISLGFTFTSLWPTTTKYQDREVESDGLQLIKLLFGPSADPIAAVASGELMRANLLLERGFREEALALYRKAIQSTALARKRKIQADVAALMAESGLVEEALEILRSLLAVPPEDPREFAEIADHFACAILYHRRVPRYAEAEQVLHQALSACPEMVTLEGTLGGLLFEREQFTEARERLARLRAKSQEPHDLGISAAYLARIATQEGQPEEAQEYVREAREKAGHHLLVKSILERLPKLEA